ncbi:MAG: DUF4492 domain-containing protein [Desulfobulbales bacterium]
MSNKIIRVDNTAELDPFSLYMGSRLLFLKVGLVTIRKLLHRTVTFYADGFRNMKLGRSLWIIILIKLLIIFGVLKIFFFPNYLEVNFSSDQERAEHVFTNITQTPTQNNLYRRSQ